MPHSGSGPINVFSDPAFASRSACSFLYLVVKSFLFVFSVETMSLQIVCLFLATVYIIQICKFRSSYL